MKAKYFSDTDTAHIEFSDKEIYETKEISVISEERPPFPIRNRRGYS